MNVAVFFRILVLSLFLLIGSSSIDAQILNVESLRKPTDTVPLIANTSLSLTLIKNKNRIFSFNHRAYLRYKWSEKLILFVSDIHSKEVNDKKIVSKGTQHLRYNRNLHSRIVLEVFAQSQYDAISAISFRGLLGIGPRFKLSNSDLYRFYMGTLTMFEYEQPDQRFEPNSSKHWRNSTYFSFGIYPNSNLSVVSTTYYQPLYSQPSDYRISNESSISFGLTKRLSFKATLTYLYDAKPVFSVPKEQYKITNGLMWSF